MLTAFSQNVRVGSRLIRMTVIFHGQKPYRHGIFFHRFSTEHSLNNNILNFKNIVCRIFLSQ